MLTRNKSKKSQYQLISATRISNYIKNDMIIDYLDLLCEKNLTINDELRITNKRKNSFDKDVDLVNLKKKKSSFDYIVESGYNFEYDIIDKIKFLMTEKNELKKLIEINELDIYLNCTQTVKIILENNHNIILGSVLINNKNNTWGKPDLIVRGDWINKYIMDNLIMIDHKKWYIIDIKSSTINLINKGEDISSKLLYSVYKSQIFVYTQALNELLKEQGKNNMVSFGFILGKKYKYVENKYITVKNSFDCLGVIDFKKLVMNDMNWENTINCAVNWINDLRENWKSFELNPINKNELYPNMKNSYDKNLHLIKKHIALVNKEITLLWNCGISNRKLAWDKGIKKYDDPKLSSHILGFHNSNKEKIINPMLKILHTDKKFILDKNNNLMDWQNKSKWEFFVDFETYNNDSIYDESTDFDNLTTSNQVIYMIGLSWVDNNKLIHKSFLLKYSNSNLLENNFKTNKQFDNVKFEDCIICNNELDLINKFNIFLLKFKPDKMSIANFKKNIRLMHWSCAEPSIFNKKIIEYRLDVNTFNLNWFDLLKIFKYDKFPIIIKECFSFGLKEIIKKLNFYGEINLSWSDLDDGLLSSFIARDIYNNVEINSCDNMYHIIEYNYIDCKALYKIIEWMRTNL